MDAMLALVTAHDIQPEQVKAIRFYAASNILDPIRYPIAVNHLQAKFSMQALLSMMVLRRQAGPQEFTDEFVGGTAMQDMQRRIETIRDPEIEAQGFEWIRSRIELDTTDGRTLKQEADKRYRGGPAKPMTHAEVEDKFRVCCANTLSADAQQTVIDRVWHVENLENLDDIFAILSQIQLAQH
jgi:2-methylcitrate dehydratase PrpD